MPLFPGLTNTAPSSIFSDATSRAGFKDFHNINSASPIAFLVDSSFFSVASASPRIVPQSDTREAASCIFWQAAFLLLMVVERLWFVDEPVYGSIP